MADELADDFDDVFDYIYRRRAVQEDVEGNNMETYTKDKVGERMDGWMDGCGAGWMVKWMDV